MAPIDLASPAPSLHWAGARASHRGRSSSCCTRLQFRRPGWSTELWSGRRLRRLLAGRGFSRRGCPALVAVLLGEALAAQARRGWTHCIQSITSAWEHRQSRQANTGWPCRGLPSCKHWQVVLEHRGSACQLASQRSGPLQQWQSHAVEHSNVEGHRLATQTTEAWTIQAVREAHAGWSHRALHVTEQPPCGCWRTSPAHTRAAGGACSA